ncbi:MAG: M1 family metallopeptidase [Candidatus Zixiibacteriota bacterium]|nr:MAG: M1 family metallopeptidase [candidate division Zixibacteria bacterium]
MIGSILLSISILSAVPDISPEVPAAYEINAYLDDSAHTVTGALKVDFVNPTSRNLDTIAFHLYPNAFKDTSSVYCREDGRARSAVERGNVSKIEISNVIINSGKIEESKYGINGTRLYVDLDKPLRPESKINIELDFEILIPEIIGHFGYDSDGDYLIAHCFPILCGYQKSRLIDWEYHANSEFFSNFSYYDVMIELPKDFKAVSTGELLRESETDSTAVWHARADTVIDFALVCGADFVEFESKIDGINLKYLLKERNADFYPLVDSTVKNSLRYCGDLLYHYPYGSFSIADAVFRTAGLELPGLIVIGVMDANENIRRNILKKTIAHETAHQWFYATIATNEFEEPWFDEGFASYFEIKIASHYEFDKFPFLFSNYLSSDKSVRRFYSIADGARYPINLKSWDYPNRQDYYSAVYSRAWMVLQALENVMGVSAFADALKMFAGDYRFRHPDQRDFLESISELSPADLTEFTEMFIDGTARVDYSIESVKFEKSVPDGDSGDLEYIVYVEVARKYDGILPQAVTLGFEDGTEIYKIWDGEDRIARIIFETKSIPVYASIDKKTSYTIDENMNNNTIYLKGHVTRMISFEWDAIFIIEFLASIFL